MKLLNLLRALAAANKGGAPDLLALALLLFRRTPMGMLEMFLLRRALSGGGRLFGMDLASRRQARLGWIAGLLKRRPSR